MNLQQALNYRENCLLCQTPLVLRLHTLPKLYKNYLDLKVDLNQEGLLLKNKDDICMIFNYNGSVQEIIKNSYRYNIDITFSKYCQSCRNLTSFQSKFEATTLQTLKVMDYAYSFKLHLNQLKYTIELNREIIQYHNQESFYHINTGFKKNSFISYGDYSKTLNDLFHKDIPPINTSNIKNVDQLIRKIQTYMIMS